MSKIETLTDAKARLWDDIVTYKPTGEVTNIQGWDTAENGEAFAHVSLAAHGLVRVPSVELVEFSYEEALDVLAGRR